MDVREERFSFAHLRVKGLPRTDAGARRFRSDPTNFHRNANLTGSFKVQQSCNLVTLGKGSFQFHEKQMASDRCQNQFAVRRVR